MKSNYMISAELKAAQNPDMNFWDAFELRCEARAKERKLERKLGLLKYKVYAPANEYATNNGFNASRYFIDELAAPYEPITELTRENLYTLIDDVRATTAREPVFIGTRDALDAMAYNYRLWDTPIDTTTAFNWNRGYITENIRFDD